MRPHVNEVRGEIRRTSQQALLGQLFGYSLGANRTYGGCAFGGFGFGGGGGGFGFGGGGFGLFCGFVGGKFGGKFGGFGGVFGHACAHVSFGVRGLIANPSGEFGNSGFEKNH